jgi:hypothetical protein
MTQKYIKIETSPKNKGKIEQIIYIVGYRGYIVGVIGNFAASMLRKSAVLRYENLLHLILRKIAASKLPITKKNAHRKNPTSDLVKSLRNCSLNSTYYRIQISTIPNV